VINLKTVTVDKITFKKHLSMIEQYSLKNFLFKWLGNPEQGLDGSLTLEYTQDVFAKLESTVKTDLLQEEHLRYVTLTEDNQIVIGVLDINSELQHRILYPDERLEM
jgi:hypothetical protein